MAGEEGVQGQLEWHLLNHTESGGTAATDGFSAREPHAQIYIFGRYPDCKRVDWEGEMDVVLKSQ